jgi:superoxide oxidase
MEAGRMSRTAATAPTTAQGKTRRFDNVTIAIHWTTLALILAIFASAWLYGQSTDKDQANQMLSVHRSVGVALWSLTVCRIAWRLGFRTRPVLPAAMPRLQQRLAQANELGLYALLLTQPLTGMAQSLTRGRPFPLFGLVVPKLMTKHSELTTLLHAVHEVSAWVLAGLIGGHALAALFHRFVLRDQVLQSMWPLSRRRKKIAARGNKPARRPV